MSHSSHKKQYQPLGPDDFKIYEQGMMDKSMRGAFRGGRGGQQQPENRAH